MPAKHFPSWLPLPLLLRPFLSGSKPSALEEEAAEHFISLMVIVTSALDSHLRRCKVLCGLRDCVLY